KLGNLPTWFYIENPFVKHIQLGLPETQDRKFYIEQYREEFFSSENLSTIEFNKRAQEFADLTDGLTNYDLYNLRILSNSEKIPLANTRELITTYKYGRIEDPWLKLDKNKVKNAFDHISKRVIGQPEAVQAVSTMLVRAKTGLTIVQHSSNRVKPRGIMFFVGPTGVGKTELAKALTELIFGDENNFIRFDMSEYAMEHAAEKFTGAPPGFVGFEEGGQLTNRVKAKPFSVILFDEIEKADPKIMDKFLQILEDGRLTDGKGETVYFSDTVLIFTSNIGSTRITRQGGVEKLELTISPEMTFQEIKTNYIKAVQEHFYKISRPELFNRLGENIIVFDRLREENVEPILRKALKGIESWAGKNEIEIEFSSEVIEFLKEKSFSDLTNGGRGVNNKVEYYILNNLAQFVFDNEPGAGSQIKVNYNDVDEVQFEIL
ncbi:AAA family ATPase, partial [Patescibacteria group bacterium]|nr:AAA family ATPase [Patescibacteria group bacterium]